LCAPGKQRQRYTHWMSGAQFIRRLTVASLFACCASACSDIGTGNGVLTSASSQPTSGGEARGNVTFHWQSERGDPTAGHIDAQLPDARALHGDYVQQTSETEQAPTYPPYARLWTNANALNARGLWYQGPNRIKHYESSVIAHLKGADGTLMRCEFLLRTPSLGLSGGGSGDCQLSSHEKVFGVQLMEARK
jgi:hypothetical protein